MSIKLLTDKEMGEQIQKIILAFLDVNPIAKDIISSVGVTPDPMPVGLEMTCEFLVRIRLEKYDKTCMFRILDVQLEKYNEDDEGNHLANWIWSQCIQALWDIIFPVRSAVKI